MPNYIYQKDGMSVAELTAATGLVPDTKAGRSVDEESWPFTVALTARAKAKLDQFMAEKGFVFARQL